MSGLELSWRKAPAATALGWFPRLRLMFARALVTDYRQYRYEGMRYFQLKLPWFELPLPNSELTFNVFWRHDLRLPFLASIQPCVGLGAGGQRREWYADRYVASAGADVNSRTAYDFYYGILALGAEFTVVPELCEFAVNCRFAFGSVQPAESWSAPNPMGYEGFHTSLALTCAMNFYLF
jgi:hypothetical protein